MPRFPFSLRVPASFATLTFLVLACSAKAPLVGQGGDCQLATDCQDGLICAPQKTGSTACPCTCTNSTQGVQQLPPAADAGKPAASADAATTTDSAPPAPIPEAGAGGGG